MGPVSQSQFLQALGWATLNSFWQMALLWCVFLAANRVFKFSANKKYTAAVGALFIGFGWFLLTAALYYQNASTTYAFFQNTVANSNNLLNVCLLSASVAYLLLLVFPAVRLLKNWRFVQAIKKEGLHKADLNYRLFVRNVAERLGIAKKVRLVVSGLVTSPVTVGYLKPMILLPAAVLNNLSTAQVEAILLHELSHIRRYDYLVNFIVSVIHTLLYFNPFVKFFMNAVEAERETCCDELVLQFGYDKVGYASALLHLEKSSVQLKSLALAAAGRQNLLTRIEKIVGMEKKKPFRLVQIVPLLAALFCVLLFNSVLIIQDAKSGTAVSYAGDAVFTPWHLEVSGNHHKTPFPAMKPAVAPSAEWAAANTQLRIDIVTEAQPPFPTAIAAAPATEPFLPVEFDEASARTTEEKQNVNEALEATKKVMESPLQWKEIEASIADAMNEKEKAVVRREFNQQLNAINWQAVAKNMISNYDEMNWQAIQEKLNKAIREVTADSLHTLYSAAYLELQKAEKELRLKAKVKCSPLPDCSLSALDAAKETLRQNLDTLRARQKKIVHL